MPSFCPSGIYRGMLPGSSQCSPVKPTLSLDCLLTASSPCLLCLQAVRNMDITIQQPWFKRALGPLYPSRLFDQFFGEGLFEYDLLPFLSSTISPYYRQSLFRTVLESGISEVRSDRDKFVIFLDVKHFSPEDLTVKVLDEFVEIHGKHSERQVSRRHQEGSVHSSEGFRSIYPKFSSWGSGGKWNQKKSGWGKSSDLSGPVAATSVSRSAPSTLLKRCCLPGRGIVIIMIIIIMVFVKRLLCAEH
uniref:Alpha-crystallin A chain n=1 Tax=Ornithorhynchus anatinus TaxID=9258 RepID=A0A6I8N4J0_ORNAN